MCAQAEPARIRCATARRRPLSPRVRGDRVHRTGHGAVGKADGDGVARGEGRRACGDRVFPVGDGTRASTLRASASSAAACRARSASRAAVMVRPSRARRSCARASACWGAARSAVPAGKRAVSASSAARQRSCCRARAPSSRSALCSSSAARRSTVSVRAREAGALRERTEREPLARETLLDGPRRALGSAREVGASRPHRTRHRRRGETASARLAESSASLPRRRHGLRRRRGRGAAPVAHHVADGRVRLMADARHHGHG